MSNTGGKRSRGTIYSANDTPSASSRLRKSNKSASASTKGRLAGWMERKLQQLVNREQLEENQKNAILLKMKRNIPCERERDWQAYLNDALRGEKGALSDVLGSLVWIESHETGSDENVLSRISGLGLSPETPLLDWIRVKIPEQEERKQITPAQKQLILQTIEEDEVEMGRKPLDTEFGCQRYVEYALGGEESALSNVLGAFLWIQSCKAGPYEESSSGISRPAFSPETPLSNWIERELAQQEEREQIMEAQKQLIIQTIKEDGVDFGSKPLDSELACQRYFEYALAGEESALSNVLGTLVWIESSKAWLHGESSSGISQGAFSSETELFTWIEERLQRLGEEEEITPAQTELILKTIEEDKVEFGSKLLGSNVACQNYFQYALCDEEGSLPIILGTNVWAENSKYIARNWSASLKREALLSWAERSIQNGTDEEKERIVTEIKSNKNLAFGSKPFFHREDTCKEFFVSLVGERRGGYLGHLAWTESEQYMRSEEEMALCREIQDLLSKLRHIPYREGWGFALPGCWVPGAGTDDRRSGRGTFVRSDYNALFKIIDKSTLDSDFTVEGAPGIGKSMMIPYVIWRLLNKRDGPPAQIFFQPSAGPPLQLYCINTSDDTVTLVDKASVNPGSWTLVDGKPGEAAQRIADFALNSAHDLKFVMFISPRNEHRGELHNARHYVVRKLMSPFTLEELLIMRRQVHGGVREGVIRKRYFKIGGVPRYIFDLPHQVDECFDKAKMGLKPKTLGSADGRVASSTILGKEELVTFSCIQPWRGNENTRYSYVSAEGRFASEAIKRKLMNEWIKGEWDDVFDVIYGKMNPYLRGVYFEEAMHALIPCDRAGVPPRTFPHVSKIEYERRKGWKFTKANALKLPASSLDDINHENDMERLVLGAIRKITYQAIYGQPLSKIFETIDGLFIQCERRNGYFTQPLKFFQYTVGDRHSVHMKALLHLWKQVMMYYARTDGAGKTNYIYPHFYFFVSDYQETFMPEAPTFTEKNREEEQKLLEAMTFHVVYVKRATLTASLKRLRMPPVDESDIWGSIKRGVQNMGTGVKTRFQSAAESIRRYTHERSSGTAGQYTTLEAGPSDGGSNAFESGK